MVCVGGGWELMVKEREVMMCMGKFEDGIEKVVAGAGVEPGGCDNGVVFWG